MAAPWKTCLSKLPKCCLSLTVTRTYSRKMKRSIQNVMSPEEDVKNIKYPIVDPTKNAYLPFSPDDPIQKSLRSAAASRSMGKKATLFNEQVTVANTVRHDNTDIHLHHAKNVRYENTDTNLPVANKVRQDNAAKNLQPRPWKEKIQRSKQRNKLGKTEDKFEFERLNEMDNRFGRRIIGARSKKDRDGQYGHQEIVLEGKTLILDAMTAGAKLKVLYFTRYELMEDIPAESLSDVQIYQVQYNHLKLWSDVETPQGLLGIFEMPSTDKALKPAANPIPLTLICDSVRDGGNMGTLIRTAAAVGCHRVIVMKGCVDVWNGKVLRSAAGTHYRVPIISNVTWTQVPALLPPADRIKVFLADSNQVTEEGKEALSGALEAATEIEKIKEKENDLMESDSESDSEFSDDSDVELEEKQETTTEALDDEDLSYKDFKVLSAYRKAPLGVQFYSHVDYTDKQTVLIISGESAGVSLPARKLAYDHYGARVTIPMEAEVESLNCSVAGSIIMYEIAKQYRDNNVTGGQEHT